MKVAILFHGNLRTFMMPLRENSSMRLCDHTLPRIVYPNLQDSDVFIATDCNDFFYEGYQYFSDDKKIEIHNHDAFRLYTNIKIESNDRCREIIERELRNLIPNIKSISIENPYDITKHEKYQNLHEKCNKYKGSQSELMLAQYRKIDQAYQLMKEQEKKQGFEYDVVFRVRFDNLYATNHPLIFNKYDYRSKAVYVPGTEAGIVYDWFAFGSRKNMEPLLEIYSNLGFTTSQPHWIIEWCKKCGKIGIDGELESVIPPSMVDPQTKQGILHSCPICKQQADRNGVHYWDVTMSSEYHVYRTIIDNGLIPVAANYYPIVYRYLSLDTNIKVEEILQSNQENLNGVKFVDYFDNTNFTTLLR